MNSEVKDYYNKIAKDYDRSRFGNSYGEFIDNEERSIINRYIENDNSIDLACGTGRFMSYCRTGVDISSEMINISKSNFPNKQFIEGDIFSLNIDSNYDYAICFHLIMHLNSKSIYQILDQVYELLNPGGIFIFDVVSAERRSIKKSNEDVWHGGNAYYVSEITKHIEQRWKVKEISGILFLPIQRFPESIRSSFLKLDKWLNSTWLKKYSSYKVFVLEKK